MNSFFSCWDLYLHLKKYFLATERKRASILLLKYSLEGRKRQKKIVPQSIAKIKTGNIYYKRDKTRAAFLFRISCLSRESKTQ